jgi:hypothetical protein
MFIFFWHEFVFNRAKRLAVLARFVKIAPVIASSRRLLAMAARHRVGF